MTPGLVRRLSVGLAAAYAALGTLEVIMKVAGDAAAATLLFFGGTLLGGAGLIAFGLFARVSGTTRRVCVMVGAAAGILASAWTLLVPLLAISVIVANALRSTPHDSAPASR
jgi:hypothetical protein